jgi:hypothetical protein
MVEWGSFWGLSPAADGGTFVAGFTGSENMPVVRAFQSARKGRGDAFVGKIARGGRFFDFLTYLGGDASDTAWGVNVNQDGEAWIVGDTHSTDFPTTEDAALPITPCGPEPRCTDRNPSGFARDLTRRPPEALHARERQDGQFRLRDRWRTVEQRIHRTAQ